jgi:hypothetical protein
LFKQFAKSTFPKVLAVFRKGNPCRTQIPCIYGYFPKLLAIHTDIDNLTYTGVSLALTPYGGVVCVIRIRLVFVGEHVTPFTPEQTPFVYLLLLCPVLTEQNGKNEPVNLTVIAYVVPRAVDCPQIIIKKIGYTPPEFRKLRYVPAPAQVFAKRKVRDWLVVNTVVPHYGMYNVL